MIHFNYKHSPASIIGGIRKAMMDAGITPPEEIIADGKLHSFPTNDKESDVAGRYILHLDGIAAGWFCDYRIGIAQEWNLNLGRGLTDQEQTTYQAQIAKIRQQRDMDDMVRHEVAKAKAINIWKAAAPANPDHPYLVREEIVPTDTLREIPAEHAASILGYLAHSNGEPLQGRLIVVREMMDHRISTLELIDESGRKSTVTGGAIGSAGAAKGTR